MLDIRIVIGIFAILHSAYGACSVCTDKYNNDKAVPGVNDTLKCIALKDYVTCLEGKLNDETCTLDASHSAAIETDFNAINETCELSAACTCQKDFFKAVTTCSTAKTRISCLKGESDMTCNGSTSISALTAATETYINGVGSCSPACICEVTYAKANISTPAKMCTALKNEISCLVGKTGNACDGSTTVTSLAATIADNINGTSDCTVTETCQCQIDFTKASVTTANKCSSAKTYSTCIGNVNNTTDLGCDEVTQQDSIKTTSSVIQKEFCSASGLRVASLLLVLPAVLFYL